MKRKIYTFFVLSGLLLSASVVNAGTDSNIDTDMTMYETQKSDSQTDSLNNVSTSKDEEGIPLLPADVENNDEDMKLGVYPNPFEETLVIQTDDVIGATVVEVRNEDGEIILTQEIPYNGANIMLETTGIERGVYYVLVRGINGVIAERKVHRL